MFTPEDHAEPDQVDAELLRGGAEQRDDDEGELEEIEEERQEEDEDVDDDQEADLCRPVARSAGAPPRCGRSRHRR